MKLFTLALISLTFAPLKFSAAESPAAAKLATLFPDNVVAKGKGFEIKRSQLDEANDAFRANAAATGQRINAQQTAALEARLLERLIITEVLTRKATEADRAKAKEVADKYMVEFKKKVPAEDYQTQLRAMGMTPAQLEKRLLEQAICEEVLDREIKAKIEITDADVKKFFEENPKQFQEPEKVKVAHVMIGFRERDTQQVMTEEKKKVKKEQAERVLARARAGDDFSKLVADFSEASSAKRDKGEVIFSRDEPQVPAEFRYAAYSMKTNQISDIIITPNGYHIIKFLERIPAKKIELAQVSKEVKEALSQQEIQKRLPVYFDQLKKENEVEVLDEKLKIKEGTAELPVEKKK